MNTENTVTLNAGSHAPAWESIPYCHLTSVCIPTRERGNEVKKLSNEKIEPLFKNEIAFVLSDVPNGRAIARTFLVKENNKYTLNQRIAGITLEGSNSPYYLHIRLNRNPYFLKFDDGVKQTNLTKSDVESFTDYYPDENEQTKIGNLFKQLDTLINQHQTQLKKLNNIKQACLEKMFV